jgi:hypothetical protein
VAGDRDQSPGRQPVHQLDVTPSTSALAG